EFQPAPGALNRSTIVSFHNVDLKTNETAENVVVIGANAKINGKVGETIVVIGGDLTLNGYVRENVVVILGDLHAGKGARFDGETVVVGGSLEAAEDVKFRRRPEIIEDPGLGRAIKSWVFQCVFKLRPLAPQVT